MFAHLGYAGAALEGRVLIAARLVDEMRADARSRFFRSCGEADLRGR